MIPKVIHWTWVGDEKNISDFEKRCIKTFSINNNYEIISHIHDKKYLNHSWIQSCIDKNQWAFANDLYRLFILYEYGGIYFDTDNYCLKPLEDKLLDTDFLIGYEIDNLTLGCGFIGVPPKSPYIKLLIRWFDLRVFTTDYKEYEVPLNCVDGKEVRIGGSFTAPKITSFTLMPFIQKGLINPYPNEYFLAGSGETENTYIRHLYAGSWCDNDTRKKYNKDEYKEEMIKWMNNQENKKKFNLEAYGFK